MLKIPGYVIERRLGQGHSGVVFLAREADSQRRVALRILNPDLPLAVRRAMLADARALKDCTHPNLLAIHQAEELHTQQYVAMAYLPGAVSLRQCLAQRFSVAQSLHIIRGVADALGYLHQRGLVHRDIRPRNILFASDGTPMLSDVSSQPLPVGGIHRYLSPEQRAATQLTPASDLYALGLVLLEILAIDSPRLEGLDLPAKLTPLRPLLEGLLAPEAAGRYACAGDFVQALDTCLATQIHWQGRGPKAGFATAAGPSWLLPTVAIVGGLLGAAVLSVQLLGSQYPHWNLSAYWQRVTRWFPSTDLHTPMAMGVGVIDTTHAQIRLGGVPGTLVPPQSAVIGRSTADRWAVRLTGRSQQAPKLDGQWQPRLALTSLRLPPGRGVSLQNDREPLITRLLSTAEAQLQAQRLTTPAGDNAVETYRAILELSPGDPRALAGLDAVAARYLRWAERAWQQGNHPDSLARIQRGLSVDPQHPGLLALQAQLRNREFPVEVSSTPQRVRIPGGPFNRPEEPRRTVVEAPPPDLWNRSSR